VPFFISGRVWVRVTVRVAQYDWNGLTYSPGWMSVLQVSVLVGRGMLRDVRCQFVLLCILSEAVVQLTNSAPFQSTVLFDVVNLIELAMSSVTLDKVLFAMVYGMHLYILQMTV